MARPGRMLIRNGRVIDGSGRAAYRADVVVERGRVVAVGTGLRGDDELDATGAVVCPGFIDLHTHYDAQVFWDRSLSPSSWHGVTTVVVGNCGFGLAPCRPENRELVIDMLERLEDMPREVLERGIRWRFETFGEYLAAVDDEQPHINVASFVGHAPVRFDVMGGEAYERAATDDEIWRMVDLVRNAMDAGAIGFATSSSPTGRRNPSMHANYREIESLTAVLRSLGRGLAAFVPARNVGLEELYRLQREIGRPFTYTALMSNDDMSHVEKANRHRVAYADGARVHPQVSCRPLVFEATLATGFALRAPSMLRLDGATTDERVAMYTSPSFRRRVEAEYLEMLQPPRWHKWTIMRSPSHPASEGSDVAALAAQRGCTGLDVALDLAVADRLATRFRITVNNDDDHQVAALLSLEGAVLGLADSGAHPDQICDAVMPTDLLGGWVRERGVLSLEAAVRKLSGELADLLGLRDRGYVRPGAIADLVVFEPDKVGPGPLRRVRDLPGGSERLVGDRPGGVRHVVVGGQAIRRDGVPLLQSGDPGPGRVVRGG